MKKFNLVKAIFTIIFLVVSYVSFGGEYFKYVADTFGARVYSAPDVLKSEYLGFIEEGEKIIVYVQPEKDAKWMEIPYENGTGYVSMDDVKFKRVVKTGKDANTYIQKLDRVANKLAVKILEEHKELMIVVFAILLFIILLIFFVPLITRKCGWKPGMWVMTIAAFLFMSVFLCFGYLCVGIFGGFIFVIYPILLFRFIKASKSVFAEFEKSTGLNPKWGLGSFLSAVGGGVLYADFGCNWNSSGTILVIVALLHLLCCVRIVKNCKSRMVILPIVAWVLTSFAIMTSMFVCSAISIIVLLVVCCLLAIVFGQNIGLIVVTSDGHILRSAGLGWIDQFGRLWEQVDLLGTLFRRKS